jgi:tRNA threonylcarbamoyladenosine biosynthesis protein TsaE
MKKIFKREELPIIAQDILNKAEKQQLNVVALSGDLGAGKTTLTQEIAKHLNIKENIISPTFVIMKIYNIESTYPWKKLIHIDAYRLKGSEELVKLGWNEIVNDTDKLIIIEWPENVQECIDEKAMKITLAHSDENTRTIEGL